MSLLIYAGIEVNPWASYQIRKITVCACAGDACRERFPRHRLQRKPLVCYPGMHHGMCVTHVPCWVSGSLTRSGGENVPGIPGACATRNFANLARDPVKGTLNKGSSGVKKVSKHAVKRTTPFHSWGHQLALLVPQQNQRIHNMEP